MENNHVALVSRIMVLHEPSERTLGSSMAIPERSGRKGRTVSQKTVVFQDSLKYISGKAVTAMPLTVLTGWDGSIFR
jgi:hypothetical protein